MNFDPGSILIGLFIVSVFGPNSECQDIFRHHHGTVVEERQWTNADTDKLLTDSNTLFEGDILIRKADGSQLSAVFENGIWPNAKIPYEIANIFNQNERGVILDAMKAFQEKTCIRFHPRSAADEHFIVISSRANSGCSSNVGRQRGSQVVSLGNGCVYPHIVKHELMHAIGFWHEQSRTDRDNYVTIHLNNVRPGLAFNFEKYDSTQVRLLNTPYDIKSIMHYPWNAFALNPSKPTITAKNGGARIEPSNDFTETDILDINRLYKCNQSPVEESKPTNSSFVWVDDNNGQVKWAWNCDYSGYDISKRISSREGCNRLCIANLGCTHFTWGTGSYCYMKSAPKTAAIYRIQGAACGYITQRNTDFDWRDSNSGRIKWANGCDFYGNDFKQYERGREDCISDCIADSRCTHFVWLQGYNSCNLKTVKNPVATKLNGYEGICGTVTQRNSDFDWRDAYNDRVKWANGCDFYAHDFKQYSSGREKCISDCIADSRCTHFGWLERHNHCNLKTINHPIVATKLNLHAGICGFIRARV